MHERVQPGRTQEQNQALRAESASLTKENEQLQRERDQDALTGDSLGADLAKRKIREIAKRN